jgi:hypothetical protein
MVKKKELKGRAIYVYPHSEVSARWKALAGESGTSISKFVIEHVENSLNQEDPDYKSKLDLIHESRGLLELVGEKEKRIHHLELLVDRLDKDLKQQRDRMFTEPSFSGVRHYDKQLIRMLREPGVHTTERILIRLHIEPTDIEAIKALSIQLESLEDSELVEATLQGFRWTT